MSVTLRPDFPGAPITLDALEPVSPPPQPICCPKVHFAAAAAGNPYSRELLRERLDRGHRAAMDQAERIKADWRALPEEEKQRRPSRVTDVQFDVEREADQCGVTVADYLGEAQ